MDEHAISFGPFRLLPAQRLLLEGDRVVRLGSRAFDILTALVEHAGESVPKGALLAAVWGIDFDPGSNVVDVCVRRLRSKLGFELIETVRGAGYRLAS